MVMLTPRELRALNAVAHGCTYVQTARALLVSAATVKGILRDVYAKLDATGAAHAVHIGHTKGLL